MDIYEFESFLQLYEKDIYSFCCHLTMDKNLADDLYQDTVVRAFEKIDTININQNPKSLLISIAIGKWQNEKRKLKRRSEIMPIEEFDEGIDAVQADSGDVEGYIIKNETSKLIETALMQIDDKYRIPMILYYLKDFNLEDISGICGIPKGTVKSRLSKGRELMTRALSKEGYTYE